jgi:tRNA nucleotidyltransferase/poly(A) polymerase
MADYIYTMESRLSPEQMRTVSTVQNVARSHGMNVYLTGGAIRDILTGLPIRDLDFTVQGDPLGLRQDIESAGGIVDLADPVFCVIHAVFQGIGVEIGMARSELFDKPGKPPLVTPATINEDLRRRDFTSNAMALSLNEGSRGLLLDPFNGAADIEARLLRVLHSYAFLEDPSRLIRATRFASRFGWELEERTRARYDSAREGEYIQFLGSRAIGYEIEQIAYEDNPIAVMQVLEGQGWLKVLCPKWTIAKANVPELAHLLKTRTTMAELNIAVDAAPAVMHFLTVKLGEAEVASIQKLIPHREFVAAWKRLDSDAKDLSKKLLSKEAAVNSGAWKILTSAKPEALLYLDVTGHNKTVDEKIKNFFGKWRQVQEKVPITQMAELRITPQLPEYARICQEAFLLLLDGKLRSESEIAKFLAPFEPPPPPPPPATVRRGRAAAKKAAAPAAKKVEVPPAIALAAEAAGAASVPAGSSKSAAGNKPAASMQLPSAEKKSAKAPEASAKPVGAKKTVVTAKPAAPTKPAAPPKPAAKAVKAPAKPSLKGKAVAKPASKKPAKPTTKPTTKPASSAGKPGKSTVKSLAGKSANRSGKKLGAKAPAAKKQHGHKEHKPEKKHSKRR